jgi:SAM-dependent methyltransferase
VNYVRDRIAGRYETPTLQNPYDRLIELFRSVDDLLKRRPYVAHQNDRFTAVELKEEGVGLLGQMDEVFEEIKGKSAKSFASHLEQTWNAIESVRVGLENGKLISTDFLYRNLLDAKKHYTPHERLSLEGVDASDVIFHLDKYFAQAKALCDEMKRVMSAKKISREDQNEVNLEILANLGGVDQCFAKLIEEPGITSYTASTLEEAIKTVSRLRNSVGFQPLSQSDLRGLEMKIAETKRVFSNLRARTTAMRKSSGRPVRKDNKDNLESWRFREEYPYKNEEEARAVQRARGFFSQENYYSEIKGLEELRKHGLLASERYDFIHQSRSHNFSSRRIDQPNPFALSFLQRTGMDGDSRVLDSGCGMGADSVAFAQTGATVLALDSSKFALDEFQRNLAADPEMAKLARNIRFVRGDVRSILDGTFQQMQVTHFFAHSTLHYFPPKITENMAKQIYQLLLATRGYAGIAIKTIESASAQVARHYRLTKDDGFNTSLSKEDRILRVYPNEKVITQVFTKAGFEIVDCYTSSVQDYDKKDEEEKFRFMILKVPDVVEKP